MKYKLGLVLLLFSLVGYGLKFTYDKFTSMGTLIATLQGTNLHLKSRNKQLDTKNKKLTTKNKKLTTKTKNLDTKNKKFVARQNKMHKKFTTHRKKLTSLKIKKARNKLLLSGAKMAPFMGISVIVGETALDIKDYCDGINEMEKLEADLFGNAVVHEDNDICEWNVEALLANKAKDVSSYWNDKYQDSSDYLYELGDSAQNYWSQKYDDATKLFSEDNNGTWDYLPNYYDEIKKWLE